MRLKYKDSESVFSEVCYDKKHNSFRITPGSDDDASEMYYYPVLKLDDSYDINRFSYKLFYNDSSCENSIYQVYVGECRIGWIFPIQALLSEDHDYADNEYFLRYAYIATCLLIKDIVQIDKMDSPTEFVLNDYVDDGKCILVLDQDNIESIEDFEISDYTVGLFKYGYEYHGKGNFNPATILGTKRLNIHPISKELRGNTNIDNLFTEQFLLASNEVIRFYICYQIIELLISKVFEHKFRIIVDELKKNPEDLFDLREDLSQITAEKERVKCLFEEYTHCETSDKTEVGAKSIRFLQLNGKKAKGNYYYDLYSVRCMLVHKLYAISKESQECLEEINIHLLNIVMDMLFSFHFPE